MSEAAATPELPEEIEALKALYLRAVADAERLRHQVEFLQEQLRLMLHQRFGRSSEQSPSPQLSLFNEAEQRVDAEDSAEADEGDIEVPAHTRRRGGRAPLPEHLPRLEVIHDLPEAEKTCPCGCALTHIRDESSEQLDILPAQVRVLRHLRRVYACRACEETLVQAPLPPQPIPKSQASPGLLAFIATQKYVDGIPLHRQEATFQRIGYALDRGTTARWMIAIAALLIPLLRRLRDTLDECDIRHLDETIVQVLKEEGRTPTSQSYIWVQKGGPPGRPVVMFHYDPSRAHTVPLELLADAHGYLQVDGYEAYALAAERHGALSLVGCWAHARRKFDEALKGQPPGKAGKAHQGLAWIRKLYAIEKRLREDKASPEERYRLRQAEAAPILAELRLWLERSLPQVPPKTLLGRAIGYLDSQWPKLVRYLEDGRLQIDNNALENAIRPFTLGRKNWLFADTPQGAHASAALYSLVETAKLSGHEPYHYLRHVLTELPRASTLNQIDALLPWAISPTALL
jgi:transposase